MWIESAYKFETDVRFEISVPSGQEIDIGT